MTIVLPEINFIETDAQVILDEVIGVYEDLSKRKLATADPLRLIFLSMASIIASQNIKINDSAKQNLLYYSRNGVLDHKGVLWSTPRIGATHATTSLRIHMSESLTSARIIKKGALVTAEGEVFFRTTEDLVILPGQMTAETELQCTVAGPIGNGFDIGKINTLVTPVPYVQKVENITVSAGGAATEDDDAYRARIQQAPEKLSAAGPIGAYEYFAKTASALIEDIDVSSPEPGLVHIAVLLEDGQLPGQEILDDVYNAVNARHVRPLTDKVTVGAPEVAFYDLDVVYYLEADAVDKTLIQEAVEAAIERYIVWQSSKIGRSINPSKLISECMQAGAKYVDVKSPAFTAVSKAQVAQIRAKNIVFGGVQDD